VGLGIIGLDRDRFAVARHRSFQLFELLLRIAAIAVESGIVGIYCDGLPDQINRKSCWFV